MKKKLVGGAVIAATVLCTAFCAVGCNGDTGGGNGHSHTVESTWSYDEYYHFHQADCLSVNHREDVALHEGDKCFCGYRAGSQGGEAPDLSGESEFGAELSAGGILTFDDIEGACKYVLSVTYAGSGNAVKYDIARGKTRVDLGSLRSEGFPTGKSTVELVAYELYTEEIDGETIEQEVPMDVKESFRVIKLNGEYSLRLLAYNDEYVKLDGFVPERNGDDTVYTYEKALTNNNPTSFNVSTYAKAASGCEVKIYRSRTDRENGENALGTFDFGSTKINQGENFFYMRSVSVGGDTSDYDLCVYGLASLKIKRYNLSFTTDGSGLRTYSQDKIGEDIEVTERDIVTKEVLYDSIAGGKIARDAKYNVIEKADIFASAEAADRFYDVYLYFYDDTQVRADKAEYDKISATFIVGESDYGISLVARDGASGSITVPYVVLGKRVIGASFGGFSGNTTITEVKFAEGFTGFVGSFTQCTGVTDIYLPSTLTDMRDFAFGGDSLNHIKSIPDAATIHCAFSASYADSNFAAKWNYIVGTTSSRYSTEYDCEPVSGGTVTPSAGVGLYYRLDGDTLTVTGYNNDFNGIIPAAAEYEGQTYNVTAIERFHGSYSAFNGNVVIGTNITEITDGAFSYQDANMPTSVTVADGNTSFVEADGILYSADKKRVVVVPTAVDKIFLPSTVTSIDGQAFYQRGKIYLQAETTDGIDFEWSYPLKPVCGAYKKTVGDFDFYVFSQGDGEYSDPSDNLPYARIIGYNGDGGDVVIPADVDGVIVNDVEESLYGHLLENVEVTSFGVSFAFINRVSSASSFLGAYGASSVTKITLTGKNTMQYGQPNVNWLTVVKTFPALTEVSIQDDTDYAASSGVVYGPTQVWTDAGYQDAFGILYILPTVSGAITIADGVVSVGGDSWSGNCFAGTGITSITLPSSVKYIGGFEGCTQLATVTLNEGLTEISSDAFKDCTALTSIAIPSTVTKIGERAFWGCTSLETVSIAATEFTAVTQYVSQAVISGNAHSSHNMGVFAYCAKLKTLTFAGTKAQLDAIVAETNYTADCSDVVVGSYITTVKCSDGDFTVERT